LPAHGDLAKRRPDEHSTLTGQHLGKPGRIDDGVGRCGSDQANEPGMNEARRIRQEVSSHRRTARQLSTHERPRKR
jgi:hypothetical protein